MRSGFQAFRTELLDLCVDSIRHGIDPGGMLQIDTGRFDPALKVRRASFVTLLINEALRGCIGSLHATRPLIIDVARNAHAAAFADPRFAQVSAREVHALDIHISILSEPEALSFTSEPDLIEQLRPGIDGLVIEDKGRRGTFLPSVWESFPEPRDFLNQLKRKAGLPESHWSERIQVARYSTETITRP
ncbi:MAG: AmmeMemoRadiSam system protein A [Gammaproteobacteria bacterium]